jgi:hypothetical protein
MLNFVRGGGGRKANKNSKQKMGERKPEGGE